MADRSKIEWTDATWNPVAGCSVISPACTNCYAMTMAHRLRAMGQQGGQAKYADLTQVVNDRPVWTGKTFFDALVLDHPLRWKRPRRIFVVSMGDLFHESVPFEWIDRVWAVMALAPQHTFQVLTKRPERAAEWLCHARTKHGIVDAACEHLAAHVSGWSALRDGLPWPLPNVWLGTTVEDQARADERIPHLLDAPAALHFLSCVPLLGPVDLTKVHDRRRDVQPYVDVLEPDCVAELNTASIGWVIAGGESGGRARPSRPEWFRTLRDQCTHAGVPFFFKQWGEWHADALAYTTTDGVCPPPNMRIGKKRAGRTLDGVTHDAMPGA